MVEVAHPQIRNRGTIGGNLAHADPASEMPAVMQALAASFTLRSVRGARTIAAADFFTGPLATALAPDEMLTEIRIPPLPLRTATAFHCVITAASVRAPAVAGTGLVSGVATQAATTTAAVQARVLITTDLCRMERSLTGPTVLG